MVAWFQNTENQRQLMTAFKDVVAASPMVSTHCAVPSAS